MKKNSTLMALILMYFMWSFVGSLTWAQKLAITIVYDNYSAKEGTSADWGFSCLIEGAEKSILFDTGRMSQILKDNIDSLTISLDSLDLILISHNHSDHTGGLSTVLEKKSNIPVYFGHSFPLSFSQNISNNGAVPIIINEPIEICKNIFSTGELHGSVKEQSLIIDTENGLVVITGCSHPGIVTILKKAKEILNKNIYLVLGGFHLLNSSDANVNHIIQEFKDLGVEKCGATHCTGDRAIALFKNAYGDNYVPMGVGQVIQIPMISTNVKELNNGESKVSPGFKLDQNFPNPFNPSTVIGYTIPTSVKSETSNVKHQTKNGLIPSALPAGRQGVEGDYVQLKVYNILGREVATLVNKKQKPGNYKIEWSASDKPSGVYFYNLNIYTANDVAGEFTDTKKLILMK